MSFPEYLTDAKDELGRDVRELNTAEVPLGPSFAN